MPEYHDGSIGDGAHCAQIVRDHNDSHLASCVNVEEQLRI